MTPTRFLIANTISLLLFTPNLAFAQEAPASRQRGRTVARVDLATGAQEVVSPLVITLKHANCFEVEQLLNGIYPQYATFAVSETNSVVFASPSEQHEEVVQLIEQLDKAATTGTSGPEVSRERLMHRKAEDVARQLMQVYNGRDLRIGVDAGRGWVLLRGSPTQIESARELLKALDTPAGSASIEFTFLRASMKGNQEPTPLPSDLDDVAKELSSLGTLSMLGRLATVAVEGEEFSVEGAVSTSQNFEVRGELVSAAEDGSVRLRLIARMFRVNEDAKDTSVDKGQADDEKPASRTRRNMQRVPFELQTTVTTHRGDYVVLGSAPTGWAPGESAVLVLHVRKSR